MEEREEEEREAGSGRDWAPLETALCWLTLRVSNLRERKVSLSN